MKIAVFGAGAIGAFLGVRLALAGEDVTLIARGPHLEAMQRYGVRLRAAGGEEVARPRCLGDAREAGPQDCVILALKAHSVTAAVDAVLPLLGPDTPVVTAQNGVPWWYFYACPGPYQGRRLESVDPGGAIWDRLGPRRAIGCVVYPACEIVEPGVVRHLEGDRFTLGEPDGSRSERVTEIARVLIRSGLKAPVRPRIRNEIWVKLWGNVAFNPISALTRAPLEDICRDPGTRGYARAVMLEAQQVARALGEEMPVDVEARIRGAESVGAHKTSMLQDLERGRPLESEAIVGAVVELARVTGVPTPTLDGLYAMVRLLERSVSLRPRSPLPLGEG